MKVGMGLALGLFTLLSLAGCQTAPTRDPAFAPARPLATTPQPVGTAGAIFVVEGTGRTFHESTLFVDNRARRIGDIVTIRLVERTEAEKESETEIGQKTSYALTNPTVLGGTPSFNLPDPVDQVLQAGASGAYSLASNLDSSKDFAGTGETTQKNRLSGEIAVTVSEVLPNGNLVVQGEKVITLTRGNEYVRFSGIVRPHDIAADNWVPSTRVANATIHYAGDGEVADSNVMGWLGRFFLSAVFPF